MNFYIRLTLVLFIIAGLSGLILGAVNEITKPMIEQVQTEKFENGLKEIYADVDTFEEMDDAATTKNILNVYTIKDKSATTLGYIFKINSPEAFDTIELLVGINVEGKVVGVDYLTIKETPGLGTKIADGWFTGQFEDIDNTDEVDTIAGATISSSSVKESVNLALEYYNENLTE